MKNFTRICLHVVASAALAATCLAQGSRSRPSKRERPPKRVPPVVVIVPKGSDVGHSTETSRVGQAVITYIPHANFTLVDIARGEVYRQGKVSAQLGFSVEFKGRELKKPGEVRWTFLSEWDIFKSGAPLTVTADEKLYSFKVRRDMSYAGVHDGLMDFASFGLIANSQSARLSVGRVAFDLTEEQRETMRDLLNVFETTEKR
ncbi:MAG: hypothetical protein QOH49_2879 [Acidobacteriota bacterium]|jgi:hypothetical protein|nr:hypothetical protein [Acidobacteriota bacterium]